MRKIAALTIVLLPLLGCASATVDKTEPRRVVGSEENVRIDAQVFADRIAANQTIGITYEVHNQRSEAIAIADLLPATSYEPETRTLTVVLGAEVPGNEFLPRLNRIASGERKGFNVGARMPPMPASSETLYAVPRYLRIRVYFLGHVEPFETLVGIPERAIKDHELADELFPKWVENSESVVTNAIPIQWIGAATFQEPPARGRRRS